MIGLHRPAVELQSKSAGRTLHRMGARIADVRLAANRRGHRVHHLPQAAFQRAEQRERRLRFRGLRPRCQHAARQAAVLLRQFDEPRQNRRDAQLPRIAAIDAAEQRLGQIVNRFLPVVFTHEIGHRFVARLHLRRAQQFHSHADLRRRTQQAGRHQRQNLGRHHHHQPVGQRHQPAAFADVRNAQMVVGPDHVAGQAQVADQLQRCRLYR